MHARPAADTTTAALHARRATVLLVLVLALVLAQALGLMHRVTHFATAGAAPAMQQQQSGEDGHWVAALFAGHASESDCRLLDAVQLDGASGVAVQVLPLVLSSFFLDTCHGDFVARWAALFDARGPPASR